MPQLSFQQFISLVLKELGAPITQNNINKLSAIGVQEGRHGTFNIMNWTRDAPGATMLNSVVKNYPDVQTGVQQTVAGLSQKNTAALRASLMSDGPYQGFIQAANGFYGTWGGGSINVSEEQAAKASSRTLEGDANAGTFDAPPMGSMPSGKTSTGTAAGPMDQIAQAAYAAGFRGQALQWMTQIAMRESGGNPGARNQNAATHDDSWGLWQINTLGGNGAGIRSILQSMGRSGNFDDLVNPVINARVAYKLSNGGTNFEPWRSRSLGWNGPQGWLTGTEQYAQGAASAALHASMGKALGMTTQLNAIKQAQSGGGSTYSQMVGWLNQQVGKPYKFATTGPDTFDCSGLGAAMYKQLGIDIPAYTYTMKDYGAPVTADQMQPGDLIFTNNWGHVGYYIGNGQLIAAPHTGAFVQVEPVWSKIDGIRRLVDAQGRVITGAGLVPQHTSSVGEVPLSQASFSGSATTFNQSGNFTQFDLTGSQASTTSSQSQFDLTGSQPSTEPPPFTLPSHDFSKVLPGLGSQVESLV